MNTEKYFRLLLLRHGNTFHSGETAYQVGCKTNLPLTEKGFFQAQTFTNYLKNQNLAPDGIFCGSLLRQTQTANLIHQAFPSASLNINEYALNEIDYGAWEGLTLEAIESRWPTEHQNWVTQGIWPRHIFQSQQETHLNGLSQWLQKLKNSVPNKSLIIGVSSNGIFRLLLQFMPELWHSLVENKKVNEYKVATGHFCDIMVIPSGLRIASWNCQPEVLHSD